MKTENKMQVLLHIQIGIISLLTIISLSLHAAPSLQKESLPVVLISEDDSPFPIDIDDIYQILSPVLGTQHLQGNTSSIITYSATREAVVALQQQFQTAQDAYFEGDFHTVTEELLDLGQKIQNHFPTVSFAKELRLLHFQVLVFQHMVQKEQSDNPISDTLLKKAIHLYPEVAVDNPLFPPWIKYSLKRLQNQKSIQMVAINAPANAQCTFQINGTLYSRNQFPIKLPAGAHSFQQQCHNGADIGLTVIKHTNRTSSEFEPFVIGNLHLEWVKHLLTAKVLSKEHRPSNTWMKQLAKQLNWNHFLVIHITKETTQLQLFHIKEGVRQFKSIATSKTYKIQLQEALSSIRQQRPKLNPQTHIPSFRAQKWYKKTPAWIIGATGLSILATGLVMGATYGRPSSPEPFIWAMQLSGIALSITGIALFVIPNFQHSKDLPAVGLQTRWHF